MSNAEYLIEVLEAVRIGSRVAGLRDSEGQYERALQEAHDLISENKDLQRRLTSHCKGEAVEAQCPDCKLDFWYVDDEPITCPFCTE